MNGEEVFKKISDLKREKQKISKAGTLFVYTPEMKEIDIKIKELQDKCDHCDRNGNNFSIIYKDKKQCLYCGKKLEDNDE